MVEDDFGEGFAIKGQCDLSICEERPDPVAERQGEAQKSEHMDQVADMEVVKETLDVKKEEGGNLSAFDACLDCMDHAKDGVRCCVVVMGSKLVGGEEMETCSIEDLFRDNPLQEFTTALKEGDGAVCLRDLVIYFTGFWDGDHSCRMPRVMPEAYSGIENGCEVRGGSGVAPLQEFVSDARGARSGFVQRAGEVAGHFLLRNGGELSGGERRRVRWVGVRDQFRDCWEEPVGQDLVEVGMGCGEGAVEFQEGRDLVGMLTMMPCCGFPQGVAGDGGEVIIGPTALGLGDGLSEGLDGIFADLPRMEVTAVRAASQCMFHHRRPQKSGVCQHLNSFPKMA